MIEVKTISHNEPDKFSKLLKEFLSKHEDHVIEEFYFSSSMGVVQQAGVVQGVGQSAAHMNIVTIYSCVMHYDTSKGGGEKIPEKVGQNGEAEK